MAGVQLLTSAGIRQLLLLRKRLASARGGLVLCAVNDRVRTLLEIAELLAQFSLADTREQALAGFESMQQGAAEPPPPTSRIGAMLFSLLGGQEVASSRPGDEKDDAAVNRCPVRPPAMRSWAGGAGRHPNLGPPVNTSPDA